MSLADSAAFIAQAWPCFPCGANKRPVTEHGFKDASRDAQVVRRLFANPGARLIGVPTGAASDLAVIDLDVKDGAAGLEWLAANEHRLPRTRRHRTRSGGLHLLFAYPPGRTIRNSQSKIGPGIDVRGEGGYIISPPSEGYTVTDDAMPVQMPAWLIDLLDPPQAAPAPRVSVAREWRDSSAPGSKYGLAALENEAQAIMDAPFGRQEGTLNAAGLKVGALVAGGELDAAYARETLIRAGLAMPSQPGMPAWSPTEVRAKAERAFADGQRNPRQAPPREVVVRVSFEPPEPPPREEPPAYWEAEPVLEPDMDAATPDEGVSGLKDTPPQPGLPLLFVQDITPNLEAQDFVEGVLVEQSAAVLYGESNAGKTFFGTDLALSVAAGQRWFGREVDQGGVVYCVLEGGFGFRNRVHAWMGHNGYAGQALPFAAIPAGINLLDPQADTPRLIEAIKYAASQFAMPVKLVVIDTLARAFAGGNENASEDMGALVLNMDRIRAETGACVLFIHHSGKDQAKGARGHSSLRAAIDTEIEVVAREDGSRSGTLVKQRELPKGAAIGFDLNVIEIGTNRRGKPVTTCVVVPAEIDPDEAGQSGHSGHVRLSDDQSMALRVLTEAIADVGESGARFVPPGVLSLPAEWWRDRFYTQCKPGAAQEAKQKAFRRAADKLQLLKIVAMGGGRVWLP